MTKVSIDPGVCGHITCVQAESEDGMEVTVSVQSECENIKKMMDALGNNFDAFEVCLKKPGSGPLYEYASQNFPGHAACPVIAGIAKCVEVECKLALPKNTSIIFE